MLYDSYEITENKTELFIGIDPGFTGAITILDGKGKVCYCEEMPVLYKKDKTKKTEIDSSSIYENLIRIKRYDHIIVLEKAQSRDSQSSQSGFTTGCGYGEIRGVLKALKLNYFEVTPQRWKKYFNMIIKQKGKIKPTQTEKKEVSKNVCLSIFPGADIFGPQGGLKDGKAESMLMAEFARRINGKL